MSKMILIGLDGASLDLIRPWAREGKLPTLARLLRHGASSPLRSTVHPYSAQAWTTMVTGVNAGRHRLFDFWERDLETYGFRLANASTRAAPAIWTVLGERGRRVIVVNVPMTFPPEPVNGILVAGRDTPGLGSHFTHPTGIKDELENALGRPYVIVPNDWRWMRLGRLDRARDELLNEVDVRFATVQHLTQTRDWDLSTFVVGATDGAAHFFWQLHDPTFPGHDPALAEELGDVLLDVYQRVDQRVEELLQGLDDDVSIVVVSDHGCGRRELRAIHLNLWLFQNGWLHFASDATEGQVEHWVAGGVARLKSVAYSLLPYQRLNRLRRIWPDRWRRRLSRHELFAGVDWSRTRAFSEERRGSVWINLRGREPQGIVAPGAEYEALCAEIVAALERAVAPETGAPVVDKVWRRDELFEGPYTDRIPDLLVEVESPSQFSIHKGGHDGPAFRALTEQEVDALTVTGDHRIDGTLILHGPGVRHGVEIPGLNIRDVFPTVLYMMGEPIPAHAEGRVAEEAFRPEWLAAHPPSYSDLDAWAGDQEQYDYSKDEQRRVEERLAGLGYMD
jgi:predicted AlkP superfamily phosphohydrolase/phosphomutase